MPVIEPGSPGSALPPQGQVALHIHVFYPELLAPILERLAHNKVQPDLFVSYSDPSVESAIRQVLANHQREASLHPVPNRGRDIGPLLSELGQQLDRSYAFHGHLHTKKSVLIDGGTAARWREFLMINLLGDADRPMADRILAAMKPIRCSGSCFPMIQAAWAGRTAPRRSPGVAAGDRPAPRSDQLPGGHHVLARQGALSSLYNLPVGTTTPTNPSATTAPCSMIERLLPQICLASGQRYAVTHVPGFSR